ncbi:hypothetical protein phytr_1660 [Candidatus Phycorickettsia trachydisci]|uniref:Uncharacterized protein n=1 Tax=Candidatus Phycorickettsia trachydisci TaxID=2115978 RepID=A0A2P1P7A3_9RICK|nr:hypothetical protein [Candidatus Phycorickettsia trachydisci]AVP87125.1 hypothetical protein phytr_1660 [Candidatus Phycorickettsia trachydisci]
MPKIWNIIISLIFFCTMSFADILSPNTGEQAMIQDLRQTINDNPLLKTKNIIIGAGVGGAKVFHQVVPPKTYHVLLTWQWLEDMKDLASGTIVVMPEHAIDKNFDIIKDKVKLITIKGVLHTRDLKSVQKESTTGIDPLTQLIVMLAGDTQQSDGSWLLYDEAMITEFLSQLPARAKILILNGPRTGKHRIGELGIAVDQTAHNTTTDYITQIAMDTSQKTSWKVVDFKFGTPSLWGPALKFCLDHPQVGLVIPGESTSMISEALSLGIRPIIYTHEAMTTISRKYVESLAQENKISLYPIFFVQGSYQQPPLEPQENKIIHELEQITTSYNPLN